MRLRAPDVNDDPAAAVMAIAVMPVEMAMPMMAVLEMLMVAMMPAAAVSPVVVACLGRDRYAGRADANCQSRCREELGRFRPNA
jgi:hypothetical protein